MRAIMVMFDTLNRRFLPPYGGQDVHAPNFERLRARTATFDTCYAGSMPCMPARRELHTGRYNFLHSSWGPIEPFDDSVPELLREAGVYTHLVSDHQHYWEDGGGNYHARFSSHEFFRGQEGDRWKGQVRDPELPVTASWQENTTRRHDAVNRKYLSTIDKHPQTLTVDAGIEFLDTNRDDDRWFLQIECFDPHEPFFSYEEDRKLYQLDSEGDPFDWPDYRRVVEDSSTVDAARREYSALLSMCDASLGRVLDRMDEYDMWQDTMLIVCTDHGFLLGEHGWWGKNIQPWYDETIHTPLFIWDPRSGVRGERRSSLVQTIDFGPTLLEFFDVPLTDDMQGRPLAATVANDAPIREAGLFGIFGGHVNVTDGRFVYMRAPAEAGNAPLFEHTLMPTHMAGRFSPAELKDAELISPLRFTKEVPVLRTRGATWGNPYSWGTLLFDLETDPGQLSPLVEDDLELRMIGLLVTLMRANDAPPSQFQRLGLPISGAPGPEHLQITKQWHLVEESGNPLPGALTFAVESPFSVLTTLEQIIGDERARAILSRHLPITLNPRFVERMAYLTPWQLAVMTPGWSGRMLEALNRELATLT